MKQKVYVMASAMTLLFSTCGCMTNEWNSSEEFMRQDISERFNFNTIASCPVHVEIGEAATIEFYDENPHENKNARVLYKAYTGSRGTYDGIMEVPGEYAGRQLYAVYNGDMVTTTVDVKNGITLRAAGSSVNEEFTGLSSDECKALSDQYKNTFPELTNNKSKIIDKAQDVKLDIKNDGTEVILNFLYSGAGDACTLYYYYFPTDPGSKSIYNNSEKWGKWGDELLPDLFANDRFKVFENVTESGWTNGGKVGTQVQLKFYGYDNSTCKPGNEDGTNKFPAGYSIAFFLRSTNDNIKTSHKCIYSEYWANTYYYDDANHFNQIQAAIFKENDYQALVIGFEDQPLGYEQSDGYKCDQDYNDMIFSVKYSPYDENSNIPDLPDDNTEKKYYDSEEFEGYLLYEDLFPKEGDFDMNDVMVKYKWIKRYTVTKNGDTATTALTSIDYEFTPITPKDDFYADYHNQFWLMIDRDESPTLDKWAEPVKIFHDQHKALEDGQTIKGSITTGSFIGKGKDDVKWSDFNPYIVVPNGYEVHLTKKKTSSNGLNDKLTEYQKQYLVENGIWPFAINIPLKTEGASGENNYPNVCEGKRIDKLYPKFIGWYNSKGQENTDWYNAN